jgi:hypothetical protein
MGEPELYPFAVLYGTQLYPRFWQIGDGDGDGPPIPGKSGMGPPSPSPDESGMGMGMGIGGSVPWARGQEVHWQEAPHTSQAGARAGLGVGGSWIKVRNLQLRPRLCATRGRDWEPEVPAGEPAYLHSGMPGPGHARSRPRALCPAPPWSQWRRLGLVVTVAIPSSSAQQARLGVTRSPYHGPAACRMRACCRVTVTVDAAPESNFPPRRHRPNSSCLRMMAGATLLQRGALARHPKGPCNRNRRAPPLPTACRSTAHCAPGWIEP